MKAPIWSLFFFKFLFLFHFFSWFIYWWWLFTSFFFFLLKNARAVNVFPFPIFSLVFFRLVFRSKNTRKFLFCGVRKKLLLFFYYYLGQWNSFFFVTVFIWAVFFSLGFLFFFFRAKFECRSWKLQQRGNILCEFAIAKTTGRTSLPSTLCHRYELKK